jgi:hypothetical protein
MNTDVTVDYSVIWDHLSTAQKCALIKKVKCPQEWCEYSWRCLSEEVQEKIITAYNNANY